MRLQHENQQLKKQQAEGTSEPVLQAMVNDMKERNDAVTAENRFDASTVSRIALSSPSSSPSLCASPTLIYCTTSGSMSSTQPSCSSPALLYSTPTPPFSTTSPTLLSSQPSLSLFNAYVNLDNSRKIKLLKKNLKWASESDLLILRKPSLFSSFLSSSSPSSSKTLTLRAKSPKPRPHSDGSQHIVIRHIHEFKVNGASPDDSGCCRTSPSSSEDAGGTLDSGISGLYDCINPVISSIAEDCAASHFTDILPVCASNSSSPTCTLQHTHCCCNSRHRPFGHSPSRHPRSHCSSSHSSRSPRRSHTSKSRSPSRSRKSKPASPSLATKINAVQQSSASKSKTAYHSEGPLSPISSPGRNPSIRSTLPPDTPTPHNSPKIPYSVSSSRTRRSSRSPSISRSPSHSSYSGSNSESERNHRYGLPLLLQRSQSHDQRVRRESNSINGFSSSSESLRSLKRSPTPDSEANAWRLVNLRNAYNVRENFSRGMYHTKEALHSSPHHITSNLVSCLESVSADRILVPKTEELKVCQSLSGLEISPKPATAVPATRKPVSVVRGVASAIRHPPSSEASIHANMSFPHANEGNYSFSGKSSPKPSILLETNFDSGCYEAISSASTPPRTPPLKPARKSSQSVGVETDFPQGPNVRKVSPFPKKGSFDIETHFGMHVLSQDSEPVTVLKHKSPQHSKSNTTTDAITMNVSVQDKQVGASSNIKATVVGATLKSQLDGNSKAAHVKPSVKGNPIQVTPRTGEVSETDLSPRNSYRPMNRPSRLSLDSNTPKEKSSFRRSASVRVSRPTSVDHQATDVTLHKSDTLFTHLVVSPRKGEAQIPPETVPRRFQNYPILSRTTAVINPKNRSLLIPYQDSDSDEEVLEHRLVAGAYGVPLVSSESCTSVMSHPDTDPSATDYNTDNGSDAYDFTPQQFKINYDDLPSRQKEMLIQQCPPPPLSSSSVRHSPVSKLGNSHRNSLTRIQEEPSSPPGVKAAGPSSPKLLTREGKLLRTNSLNGIVKKKNKLRTAKMVAAETFNAMFTLCTPWFFLLYLILCVYSMPLLKVIIARWWYWARFFFSCSYWKILYLSSPSQLPFFPTI